MEGKNVTKLKLHLESINAIEKYMHYLAYIVKENIEYGT